MLLLSSLHFLTGYLFLQWASSPNVRLFTRATAPSGPILRMALAGAGSIALLNYSLRLNSVGTYQIMKVAILPAVMGISFLQGISSPSRGELSAAGLVVLGTLVCTASDVWMTLLGLLVGLAGVLSTAQYQIWQGSVQKELGLNSTQTLHLMSWPQAYMTFIASVLVESDWGKLLGWQGPVGEGPLVKGGGWARAPPPLCSRRTTFGATRTRGWSC